MTTRTPFRTRVFISYSHQDREWLERLRTHLKPLERTYEIDVWDDTKLKPGLRWREEIRQALRTTSVAVLLVSADFLASDFITTDELPPLLNAAEKDGARVLPLILSPCRFLRTRALSEFQSVNDPSKALISLPRGEQEEIFFRISEIIEDALSSLTSKDQSQDVSTKPLSKKTDTGNRPDHRLTRLPVEANTTQTLISRIPNNDLGYGVVIGGSYKDEPLEVVASPWIRYHDSWVISGWLYASPYSDISHAVAFFKSHLRDDGSGYIHILDSSNPTHTIYITTSARFRREEEFCWDFDSEVQRTALWEFTWQ